MMSTAGHKLLAPAPNTSTSAVSPCLNHSLSVYYRPLIPVCRTELFNLYVNCHDAVELHVTSVKVTTPI